jgi:hypothetical protein
MMETARTSETMVNFYQTRRRYNPEDSHLDLVTIFEDGTYGQSPHLAFILCNFRRERRKRKFSQLSTRDRWLNHG